MHSSNSCDYSPHSLTLIQRVAATRVDAITHDKAIEIPVLRVSQLVIKHGKCPYEYVVHHDS